jgi:hypothetical protein
VRQRVVQARASRPPNKNIENNPMQSSMVVAGMDASSDPEKTFDTSGKSPALIHHRAILKSPMALPDGLFGAIAGQKSLPTIEVAPARHGE